MAPTDANPGIARTYQPTPKEVGDLLRRAAVHPLGSDFLLNGSPDAVAATFGVHAFMVDAARQSVVRVESVEAQSAASRQPHDSLGTYRPSRKPVKK